jgi:hypothetical protein
MKLSEQSYNIICTLLSTAYNEMKDTGHDKKAKRIEEALQEIEEIGTY